MTLSIAERRSSPPLRSADRASAASLSPLAIIAIGSVLSLALSWSGVVEIWRTGNFLDTDDAMRMVQIRAWLAGQGWFDLNVHRLDPPQGVFLHWSRIVDLPVAGLIGLFSVFTTGPTAELLARLIFPLGLQVGLIAATVPTARVLVGPSGALPAMLLIVTNCFQFGQFVPGRIDHHAPQITLLMTMAGLMAAAILRAGRLSGVLAALAIATSLAISLENLPFIAVAVIGLALSWAAEGEPYARVLRSFGASLAGAAVVLFVVLVAPARYGVVSPDAYSLPHAMAAMMGGAAFAILPTLSGALATPSRRLVSVLVAGAMVAGVVAALCPGILTSPYAQVDPVVHAVWLARVTEALPLPTAVRLHPQAATLIVAPLLAGLVALGGAAIRERGRDRAAWLLIGIMTLIGLAGSFWEVRIVSSTTPLAVLGGVWAFTAICNARGQTGMTGRPALLACLVLPIFSPIAWALVPVPDESAAVSKSNKDGEVCRTAASLAPLAALNPGTIFAPIDSGSHLLVSTNLSVIGAPYHRNNHGNRTVIDGFSADGPAAERIVKETGARYVTLCPGQAQAEALTERNPNGLAAQLLAGHPPSWLEPLTVPGTPYLVFLVR